MNPLRRLFRREKLYTDLSEELRQHLAEKTDHLVEQGMPPREAAAKARRELGNVTAIEEESRDAWRRPVIDSIWFDLRYAGRQLRREPSFAVVAILILGLSIGATTAVFSLVNAVLMRPLPFEEPERLVRVANTGEGGLSSVTSRSGNLRDWRQLNETFVDLAGFNAFFDYSRFTLTGAGEPERLVGVGVTETFLPVLGVEPLFGRNFTPEECQFNGRPAALLTHSFWLRRFGSDQSIIGETLTLNSQAVTVVGVLPKSFDFGSIFSPGSRIDLLVPFAVSGETDRWGNTLAVIGRLQPGITIDTAQSELDLINERLKAQDPERWGLAARVSDLRGHLTGPFQEALGILMAAVGLVLLIACINLSNLLLSRAAARRKEIAVRSAMGAGRARVVRQLLTESLLLAACGGFLGVAFAYGLTQAVTAVSGVTIPLLSSASLDVTALGFAVVIVLGSGILFGLAPAVQVSASRESAALRESGRGMSEGRERAWLRSGLVVFEAALACVLLVGAGLLLRSFMNVLDTDLGFQPEQRIAWRVDTSLPFDSNTERVQFFERLMDRIEAMPGVDSVGLSDTLPLGRNRSWGMGELGKQYAPGEYPTAFPRLVSPGYIETMGIPLIRGRLFTAQDGPDAESVVILSEASARLLWPDADAIGKKIGGGDDGRTVVGVVASVRHGSLEDAPLPEMYFPIAQLDDWGAADVVVRSRLPIEMLSPGVRRVLHELDPNMATGEFQSLDAIVDRAASPRRFVVSLLSAFAAAALLLASLGIYGVVSYSVTRRVPEFGIRMALGASGSSVRGAVLGDTFRLAATGLMFGVVFAVAFSSLLASQLFGVSPRDPLTFVGVTGILLAVALISGYIPALQASRVSPMTALRSD